MADPQGSKLYLAIPIHELRDKIKQNTDYVTKSLLFTALADGVLLLFTSGYEPEIEIFGNKISEIPVVAEISLMFSSVCFASYVVHTADQMLFDRLATKIFKARYQANDPYIAKYLCGIETSISLIQIARRGMRDFMPEGRYLIPNLIMAMPIVLLFLMFGIFHVYSIWVGCAWVWHNSILASFWKIIFVMVVSSFECYGCSIHGSSVLDAS